jgi:O-methyltransferase
MLLSSFRSLRCLWLTLGITRLGQTGITDYTQLHPQTLLQPKQRPDRLSSMDRAALVRTTKRVLGKLWPRYSLLFDIANRNALLSAWIRRYHEVPIFSDRDQYFAWLHEHLLGKGTIDYLEFGVYRGESIAAWYRLNEQPSSRFFGFDTFEGLPERWEMGYTALEVGYFSTDGQTPATTDDRVRFIKGRFQDTLDSFLRDYRRRGRLVVHIDADIYSSALYVLTKLDPLLAPGALVMFDEFASALNEFRAFDDYMRSYRRTFRPVAAVKSTFDQHAIIVGRDDRAIDEFLTVSPNREP